MLGKEATGGETARDGFGYQDFFILVKLPEWLAQDAFSGVVSETVGDIEVCYFTPDGERRVFFEAKNYVLSPKPFWEEMVRFQKVFNVTGDLYTRFGFVAPEMPSTLSPMFAKLSRIRGVGSSFEEQAKPLIDAKRDFVQWVVDQAGQPADLAEFVLEYVDFIQFDDSAADSRFVGELTAHLPCLEELPGTRHKELRSKWKELVQHSGKRKITRRDLEAAVLDVLPAAECASWLEFPSQVRLQKGVAGEARPNPYELVLDLRPFLGEDRGMRTKEEWRALVSTADAMADFMHTSRVRRRVEIDAELRMSAAVVLGVVFKATKGHLLELTHREAKFHLQSPERDEGAFFTREIIPGQGSEAVVVIQIGHVARGDMHRAFGDFALEKMPRLYLETSAAIPSISALNGAVHDAKAALVDFRSTYGLTHIHMFLKGPSFFAIAIGHRLNALGEVQLYDWVANSYHPTARFVV
ncbi:hypothetical protein NCCP691_19030 [Noviherbaspirillum aridicola]|uniref:SMODS-associated and fused to various effectors domain-containing protein n=1 Tax=Noviherbaspirillum aridicola TaxID=2849687 RepID=A0ABQ4Q572_9BURK|nr:hypothetical protein NCCP691_19030 [Noviherbaspirillum aridicola]